MYRVGKSLWRPVLVIALTLMVASGLVGGFAAPKLKITYWTGWGGSELETLKKIIAEFNAANPEFEVETTTIFGAYEKLITAVAGGRAPDVVSAVWASQLPSLAHNGALIPIDNYLAKSDKVKEKDFYPAIWQSFKYNGHVWGLNAVTNTWFMVYNKKMFREAGLDPDKPPTTLADFEAAVEKLTQWDSKKNITRLGWFPETGIFRMALIFGGNWYDAKKQRLTIDNPRNIAALKWITDYWAKYGVDKLQTYSSGLGNYWSPNNPFIVGKYAIQDYGEWIEQFVKQYNPTLEYGVMPYPYPAGGRKNFTTFGGSIFCIPKGSEHPDQAWEFIEWITGPYAQKKIAQAFANMPTRIAVANDRDLLAAVPILKMGKSLFEGPNAFPDSLPIPISMQFLQELTRVEEQATRGLVDPAKALRELQVKMQRELEKTRAK